MTVNFKQASESIRVLQNGGVGVLPTDTIYGLVGSALNRRAVTRIYKLRRRNPKKPVIVLINSVRDLGKFGVKINRETAKILGELWPGKVSVILPLANGKSQMAKLRYLHRGAGTLAFRLPKPLWLRRLLRKTGPLVAPSANWEGKTPARTVEEARRYFGKGADFYVSGGRLDSRPSTLVKISKGKILVLRLGAVKI